MDNNGPNDRVHDFFAFGLALGISLACPTTAAQSLWPPLPLPPTVETFDAGEQLTINGQPTRLRGFVSAENTESLAAWFRRRLGEPLVESDTGSTRVLSRIEKGFFLTVQLEPAGNGSRGLIAATDLKSAAENLENTRRITERWQNRLLPDSQLLSQTSNSEDGRISRQVVFVNAYGSAANRDRMLKILREDGMTLEYESNADDSSRRDSGRLLMFKGRDRDAMAVIGRDDQGRTAVVLNLVTALENTP